jgi:hypothetical protein
MVSTHTARGMGCALLIAAIIAVSLNVSCASAKKPVEPSDFIKVNETELQSRVMRFVDRMPAILLTAFARYDKTKPATPNRNQVLSIVVYSLWNAYIIASESDPDIALLDMISMVTLGRIVFEEQGIPTFGPSVQSIVTGFRKAEKVR